MAKGIGLQVKGYKPEAEKNELVDQLREKMMEYRSDKIDYTDNFPFTYSITVNTGGETAEEALYGIPASSQFSMGIEPGTPFHEAEEMAKAIQFTKGTDQELTVYPENICKHLPNLQEIEQILNENDYQTSVDIHTKVEGQTVEETFQNLTEEKAPVEIHLKGPKSEVQLPGPEPAHPSDVLYTDLFYDSDTGKAESNIQQCSVPLDDDPLKEEKEGIIEENIERIESEIEQILEPRNLFKD